MNWQVSKLDVDFNSDQVTVEIASLPVPNQTVVLNFSMPETVSAKTPGAARAAFSLDQTSRKAILSQAKQVLMDAANTL